MSTDLIGNSLYSALFDGQGAGYIKKVDGGTLEVKTSDVAGGGENRMIKARGNPSYKDISLSVLMGQSKYLIDWMNLTLADTPKAVTGVIQACNVRREVMAEMETLNTWIKKVQIPKMDANSDDALFVDVDLCADRVNYKNGDKSKVTGLGMNKAYGWRLNAFRMEMGNMPCDDVISVEVPSIEQSFQQHRSGAKRFLENMPSVVKLGNIKITFPIARGWNEWSQLAQAELRDGGMSYGALMDGALTFLAPNQSDELGRIEFQRCGLVSLTKDAAEGTSDKVATATAELAPHDMKLFMQVTDS